MTFFGSLTSHTDMHYRHIRLLTQGAYAVLVLLDGIIDARPTVEVTAVRHNWLSKGVLADWTFSQCFLGHLYIENAAHQRLHLVIAVN